MKDSTESSPRQGGTTGRWLLLIHQLPPKPDYLRVKVRRRLRRLGALPLKNSVYVLPAGNDTREDFEWLARAIEADGGEASVCEATFLAGVTDAELQGRFGRPGAAPAPPAPATPDRVKPGRTWVTRADVGVDRLASAWLIRRFIDPRARFRFVDPRRHRPRAGELRFDMFEGEYTHAGDRCTFETLVHRFRLSDRALPAIGEIVHDIDCKDDRFGRPETAGVATLVRGITLATRDDDARVARAAAVWDDLAAYFAKRRR
ncbi:MAG TPA: chromate resistance protein ChrB domain-containing protein [Gemmatimonadales bacterium]